MNNTLVNLQWAPVPNMPVQFIKCVKKNGSCVNILSHWPNTLSSTVVFVNLFQLGNNHVIYEDLKVDISLPYSL
jgi:hypothetical protein